MKISPLRNMVLLAPTDGHQASTILTVVSPERAICRFRVVACGPEVRDVAEGQTVLANRLAGTVIGAEILLPESSILGVI